MLHRRIAELVYEYAFLKHEDLELSGSFGVHGIKLGAALRGDVTSPGGGGSVETVREGTVNGPLRYRVQRVRYPVESTVGF